MEFRVAQPLTEAECSTLFRAWPLIHRESATTQLCGLSLVGGHGKLRSVGFTGTALVEASIDAPDIEDFETIAPREFCEAVVRMKGNVLLGAGDRFIAAECGDSIVLASKVIPGKYPSYRHAIPQPSGNQVEIDRAALLGSLSLLRSAYEDKTVSIVPMATIAWAEGADELLLELPDERGSTVIPARAVRGGGFFTVMIGPFTKLLKVIDGDKITLDCGGGKAPIRITKPGDGGLLAVQTQATEGKP
jgi:DNA polymerase III sliding clamp (beta) subunit (PCNA family)